MVNQGTSQGIDGPRQTGASIDLVKFWDGLGFGGRVGVGFALIFVVAFIFTSSLKQDWIDIPVGDVERDFQLTEILKGHQIEFRFSASGGLQVPSIRASEVFSLLHAKTATAEQADPFDWVNQSGSLIDSARQREQRWERSQIEQLEEDLARLEGIHSVSVTPNRSSGASVIASSRKITGVSVQVELDLDLRPSGLSHSMARSIALHVSGAYGVAKEKVIITDTTGNYYDLDNPQVTAGDVLEKMKIVEQYVVRYLSAIFDPEMYRVIVDVSLASPVFETVEKSGYIPGHPPVVPGIYDLQEQVATYSPISAQFADSVVTRATAQQIPGRTVADPEIAGVEEVAVTVMLDRQGAIARASAGRGAEATNGQRNVAQLLREFTATIVDGLESHLRVHVGSDSVIQARVLPVNFKGVLSTVQPAMVQRSVTDEFAGYPFSFYFLICGGMLAVFWVFRHGPRDSIVEPAITGFGSARFAQDRVRESVNSIFEECETSITDKAIEQICNLDVPETVEVLRHVISHDEGELPGCSVLALLVLDQSTTRAEIFDCMNPEELSILSGMICEVEAVNQEKIADALAVLELFQGFASDSNSPGGVPSAIGVIPTQLEIQRSVIDDIRSNDAKLADLIEGNRSDSSSREVQSS